MIKVLEVINLFGSAENFIGGQFKYLKDNGYEMHLICSPDERIHEFAKEQGCRYKEILLERQVKPVKDLKALFQIRKYIKKNKINVVICHQAKGNLLGILAAASCKGVKIVSLEHGALFETAKGWFRWALINESRFLYHFTDKIVSVSEYIRELGIKYKLSKPGKRVLLGSGSCGGIDTIGLFNPMFIDKEKLSTLKNKYNVNDEDFIIGFVGRMVIDKGVVELIEGFRILKEKHTQKSLKLMVVGEPEKWNGLPETTLEELHNNKDIIFTGFVPREEMPYQYSLMDVLVLPSYREGLGLCNLEAQAMYIPVITTKLTGCRDSIVENETGLYCDLNGESIAQQVENLFDKTKREIFGKNGRKWVADNFDHTKVWPHMKDLLDALTSKQ